MLNSSDVVALYIHILSALVIGNKKLYKVHLEPKIPE